MMIISYRDDPVNIPYEPPSYQKDAFNCPFCGAFSKQTWVRLFFRYPNGAYSRLLDEDTYGSRCERCNHEAIWISEGMIYPASSTAPLPVDDMPEDVRLDYEEARGIVNVSPRAAAALLRLGLQKLMVHLGQPGKNLNEDIEALVKQGLPRKIQQALDSIRVIGNNAVHPGEIDIRDDVDTVHVLFNLLNYIVQNTITQQKEIEQIYDSLPPGARTSIEKRDTIRSDIKNQ